MEEPCPEKSKGTARTLKNVKIMLQNAFRRIRNKELCVNLPPMGKISFITASLLVLALHSVTAKAQETADSVPYTRPADEGMRTPRIRSTRAQDGTSPTYTPCLNDTAVTSMPWMGYAWGGWDLHQGLNAQIGAGVRVGWGRGNPWRGASFFTDIAAMYCLPLSQDGKWSAAVGGYFSNYRLWGRQVNSVGVCGLVDYRFNDRVNLSGFVMHDFGAIGGHQAGAPQMPFLDQPRTTVGAQLGINASEKLRVEIGLSFTRENGTPPYPADPTGRPLPMRPTRSILDPDF